MFKAYLKIAVRNINKHKLFTAINVLGLAMGFCTCLVIYLVTTYELGFDSFHPGKQRIYRVSSKEKENDYSDGDVPAPAPATLSKEITGIETLTAYYPYSNPAITIPASGQSARKFDQNANTVIIADPQYFSVFKYDWLAGNASVSLDAPFTVVLSEKKAHTYFGAIPLTDMIGKEVVYNDSLRVTVSGIVKDWTENTDFSYTDFISFSTIQASFLKDTRHTTDWRLMKGKGQYYWPVCFVKLSVGATVPGTDRQLAELIHAHIDKESAKNFSMFLQPLKDIHFNDHYSHDNIRKAHLPTLYAIMAIALFILIIAAVNFINLSTAQSLQRAKEIGVRKVLGSSRASLVVQFLTETCILCFAAAFIAVLLANPVLVLFRDFIPAGVKFSVYNAGSLLFLLGITLVTALLAGLYPARIASGFLPIVSLQGTAVQQGNEKWLMRKGLIVFQFSISLVFIIGTIVIGSQIRYMLHSDFGLKIDAVVSLDNWSWKDNIVTNKVLREKLQQLPGVQKVMLQSGAPMGWGLWTTGIHYKDKQDVSLDVSCNWANEDFIPFYGIHLLAGRNILHSDSLTELVINETCARALGFTTAKAAVGKFLYLNNKPLPIVGIAADFHESSFHDVIKPLVIGHQPLMERSVAIRLASKGKDAESIKPLLAGIEKIWKDVYPDKDFAYSFMDQSVAGFYDKEQKTMKLSQVAMYITIFISCMGLFGLVMFTAEKRTKEFGIRKVLGAGAGDIALLLTRDFLVLIVIAFLIASPVAWIIMHGWLQDFAYRIIISWWVFVLAGLAAAMIAIVTISFQAMKVAIANPVVSLRTV